MNPETFEELIHRGHELFEQDEERRIPHSDDWPDQVTHNPDNNEPMWDGRADIDHRVIDRVREHGIDTVLAIYKPISLHGKHAWGIRYFTKAIQSYINHIYRQILVTEPNAMYSVVSDLIFESIRRHEFEHFVQEMVYLAGSMGSSSVEDYARVISDHTLELEGMAAHFEILDSWSQRGDKRIRNIVLLALSDLGKHGPYSNWRRLDVDSAEINFEHRVSIKSALHLIKKIRSSAAKFSKTKVVPEIHLP
jgi:hypothetical protein